MLACIADGGPALFFSFRRAHPHPLTLTLAALRLPMPTIFFLASPRPWASARHARRARIENAVSRSFRNAAASTARRAMRRLNSPNRRMAICWVSWEGRAKRAHRKQENIEVANLRDGWIGCTRCVRLRGRCALRPQERSCALREERGSFCVDRC